jgi:hypothetical protein
LPARRAARELLGRVIGGEETLDLQLLQRDVARRGELVIVEKNAIDTSPAPKLHGHHGSAADTASGSRQRAGDAWIRKQFVA